ncbi:MAG TPA: regulatory iron-sulfur-containing complex subunit RicT [bacterium]|uniref:PSP1 C-terminal domain-containing protein n=1 Tax=candidate division TA06 bacterium ADurb.Bin417 TaxID=1852828 RepID=A0A1V5MKF5_UNCT6|nr:MAG: hypothetical protein BWY73_00157 [candidate division TA06 bacterium ADurb.Bin417]HNQ34612.1 regulatory iron-sulfur-containing complex subunit RicT [bacterium]HNS48098.1 regulatory iron-sulfur-containing complex subunit RicT [bacterium]
MKFAELRIRRLDKVEPFSAPEELEFAPGDYVIIESSKSGLDYGIVLSILPGPPAGRKVDDLSSIVRKVTPEDIEQIEENYEHDEEAFRTCQEKILEKKLANMKLLDAEYSFNRSVVTFYYYAEERIDFRELVRELAKTFNCRIEMRQVGRRDEARMLGGFGVCGRRLCCSLFLREFKPVTMRMVKDQNLPLDTSKVSGLCSRLMCCLAYEHHSCPRQGNNPEPEEAEEKDAPNE